MSRVFLSYARADASAAERLYMDLRRAEIDVWMDIKCLLPGQNWEHEIRKQIKGARYFIALVSKASVGKRGFVQREMRIALDLLEEVPIDQAYLLPVRVDESEPPDFKVQAINRVDLFPSYRKGYERLVAALTDVERHPLVGLDTTKPSVTRAPIEFTPYRDFDTFVRDLIQKIPDSAYFHDRQVSYFITFRTAPGDVVLPERLRPAHPERMTIVLRAAYLDLEVRALALVVKLVFDDVWETIEIPFRCIDQVTVPQAHLLIARLPGDTAP